MDDSGLFNGFNEIRSRYATSWPLSGANVLAIAQAAALPNFSWIKPPPPRTQFTPITATSKPWTGACGVPGKWLLQD